MKALALLAHQDRVLVAVDPDPEMEGSFYVPENYSRFSRTGRVMAVGAGRYTRKGAFVPTEVKPGDRVLLPYSANDMHVFEQNGDEYRLLHEGQLLAVEAN